MGVLKQPTLVRIDKNSYALSFAVDFSTSDGGVSFGSFDIGGKVISGAEYVLRPSSVQGVVSQLPVFRSLQFSQQFWVSGSTTEISGDGPLVIYNATTGASSVVAGTSKIGDASLTPSSNVSGIIPVFIPEGGTVNFIKGGEGGVNGTYGILLCTLFTDVLAPYICSGIMDIGS